MDAYTYATLTLLHTHIVDIDADEYKKDPRTGRTARQVTAFKRGTNELRYILNVAVSSSETLT